MAKTKKQRGFIIPYYMLPALKRLGEAAAGRFIFAMGDYSEQGILPDFGDDARSEMLWFSAQPWLDDNAEKYEETQLSRMYSGWCSSLAKAGKEYLKIEFNDWCEARAQYDDYCANLPPRKKPALFTDWLQEKRERAREEVDGELPWGDDP